MKRISIVLAMVLLTGAAFAQDDEFREEERSRDSDKINTIFNNDVRATGFGSFDMAFTGINDGYALLLGGHGGLIFNKKIMLGFGGMGITTPVEFNGINPTEPLELTGGYGGFLFGYILAPREVFHVAFPVTLGVGGLDVRESAFNFDPGNPNITDRIENSVFVIVEPGVQLEVNVTRFFRLGLGLTYRFTEGVDLSLNNITDKDISGLAGNVSFKFGGF